jgi:hypothetical protein
MAATRLPRPIRHGPRQRGAVTLLVALVVLVVLTVIILASTNVALFEQKTATNENRQRLADQAAKYALQLGGEFFKANIVQIGSGELGGWLAPSTRRWLRCSNVAGYADNTMAKLADGSAHPCMAEPDPVRRAQLYYYSFNDALTADDTIVPYQSLVPAAQRLTTVGGGADFAYSATVRALLCRLDTSLVDALGEPKPACMAAPAATSMNRVALTLVSSATIPSENAAAQAKETWASFISNISTTTVPLVASGSVNGVGNVEIVADPNGAGPGLPVSVWSAADADVDKTGGGSAASVSSCQLGEFLNKPYRDHNEPPTPESELKTTCATDNNACGCPAAQLGGTDFLSGKVPGGGAANACCENIDILDVDGGKGSPKPIPDIRFFPGAGRDHAVGDAPNTVASNASALADDSLFEWVFGVANESVSTNAGGTGHTLANCGASGDQNCAIWALSDPQQLNAQVLTCAQLNAIGAEASGLYYVSDSPCALPAQVGSPSAPAIVVVSDEATLNNTLFYGMLFVRSDDKTGFLRATGNAMVFGSAVVEGSTDIAGGLSIVYDPTSVSGTGKNLPRDTRLARVPGSWLDTDQGGF